MVIDSLRRDGDGLRWPLVQCGESHAMLLDRGFLPIYFHTIGEALLELIAQCTPYRYKR